MTPHRKVGAIILSQCLLSALGSLSPSTLWARCERTEKTLCRAHEYFRQGLKKRAQRKLKAAIQAFQNGVELDPKNFELRAELAMTQAWDGQFQAALATYDALLALQPGLRGAVLGRARVLAWAGHHQEAQGVYERVLAHDPSELEALRGIAFVHRSRMRFHQARAYYQRALAIDSADRETHEGLAAIARQTRWQVGITAGLYHLDEALSFNGGGRLSYRIDPEYELQFGYEADLPSGVGATTGADPQISSHTIRAGLLYRSRTALTIGGAYELGQAGLTTHRLALSGSLKLSDTFVMLAGARPGLSHNGRLEVLSNLGLQFLPQDRVWIMSQIFFYADTQGQRSWTAVGTAWWRPHQRFALLAGGGGGLGTAPSLSFFGKLSITLSERILAQLHYEYLHLPFRRHTPRAGIVVRF